MRPSPRLSLFAILSGLVLVSAPVWAAKYEYDFTTIAGTNSFKNAGGSYSENININSGDTGGLNFNGKGRYVQSPLYKYAITNVTFNGRAVNSYSRILDFYLNGLIDDQIPSSEITKLTRYDFYVRQLGAENLYTSFKLATQDATGQSQALYVRKLTVYTIDPELPKIGEIQNQSVGSENVLPPLMLPISSYYGDSLTVAVGATNALNESVDAAVDFDSDTYVLTFTPADAGITSGDVTITVTATGTEGTVSRTFTITIAEGNVETPPTIDPIEPANREALALRPLLPPVSFTIHPSDGDQVLTNVECFTSGVLRESYRLNENGDFTYTPTLADAALSQPILFGIIASDDDGAVTNYFTVTVTAGTPPALDPIAPQTVAYDGTNKVTLVLTPTDDDAITATNVDVKVGTTAPVGERTFSDRVFRFVPAVADIGQTFIFTASATDFDGTTNVDFNVEVILAAPVLKHCPVEDWTQTSFTADLEAAVPGATSYNLRRINSLPDGTKTTQTVNNVTLPYTFTDLPSTNQHYWAQAVCGNTVSAWSAEQTVSLQNWLPFVPAVEMTGAAHGSYAQDFNSLPSSGGGTWYDGCTLPGWYASFNGSSFTDGAIQTWKYGANNTATGFFSFGTEKDDDSNRGIGVKNSKWADDFRFAVAFTNTCQYAVTNINVSFTACQFRYGKGYTQLQLSHVVSDSVKSITSSSGWKDDKAFYFDPDLSTNAMAMDPQYTRRFSGDIPLTGNDTLHTGLVLMLMWKNVAENNSVPVGIDDLEVKWQCAWPRHTVIYLR